jgi:predicted phage baseplate assembly protein
VVFGDGVNGAPPPTGGENVTADYRTGIGQPGMVGAGALTLFATRPPGVKDVTNPLPAQGAQDPQSRDDARVNAPLTLATLGRVVSMSDYEDFARAFAGIGKALSTELWRGQRRVVHVTVAGPLGAAIPNDTLSNLIHALENVRDPGITVEIEAYMRIFIRVTVDVLIDPRLEAAPTVERVRAALAQAFDFGRRSFGQAVSGSQIIATVLQVPGIVDTRILALHQVSEGVGEPAEPIVDPILSRLARWVGELGEIAAAELVLLEPAGATVTVRAT